MLLEERDYFTDRVVLKDPYDYFAELFSKDPIYQPKLRDVMFVTGFEEANAILRNVRSTAPLNTASSIMRLASSFAAWKICIWS